MAMLLSSWSKDVQANLPESYVFPPDQRPQMIIPPADNNPIIDLSNVKVDETVEKIMAAGQEFGFFQVINHGIHESIMREAMDMLNEFFRLPGETKEKNFKTNPDKRCRLYTSTLNYDTEEVHIWRDNLTHPCHPLEDCVHLWPEKPNGYREVVGKYTVEVRRLAFRMLDLICQGLELREGYFDSELSRIQLFSVNFYPRCPNPSLALGMHRHSDPNLVTILSQGEVSGLQVFKNGNWIGVEPIPNALVVIIGCQLEIISNGKVRSTEHRVVTNSEVDRISMGYFVIPTYESISEPAKNLVDEMNPRIYKPCQYQEFLNTSVEKKGAYEAMECYKL